MNQLTVVHPTIPAMTVSDVERVATAIAKGGLFGSKDPNAVLTLCLLAQAEGQHPAVVFRDYHIIQGKPAKKAEAMLRDFINAGGKIEWHKLTDECADATFSHPGGGSARIEWTMKRAQTAGINTPMWKKYPRQMLRSRVISEGVRTVYPGATSGLYEESEVRDMTGDATPPHDSETGEIIEAQPEPVKGIHKIKERLRTLINDGSNVADLDSFNALVKQHATDLTTIKDAHHEWWTGDGEDFEGFRSFIKRRREELAEPEQSARFQLIMSGIAECTSSNELKAWFDQHGDQIGLLDGEESRQAEQAYEEKSAALAKLDEVTVGG